MFKAARWRSERNRIRAVFKLQLKATQVPGDGWESMTVTLVPVDVGKPSQRSEKTAIVHRACHWLNPIYATVKLSQDQRTGRIGDRVYQFIVSATGSAKSGVLGEISINLAEYAEVFKPTSVSVPLQGSNNGAILHVTIQRMHGDVEGRETVENGEIPKESIEKRGTTVKQHRITLKSQLSNPEYGDGGLSSNSASVINSAEEGSFINSEARVKFHSSRIMHPHEDSGDNLRKSSSFDAISASGSESSSGQYTPKENGIKNNAAHQDNAGLLSPLSSSDTPRNIDCSMSSAQDGSIAGSTKNSGETGLRERALGSENTLARQLEVSELELQTLRKQVVKESRRGQDLSKELSSLKEERDALRKECEELKALKKRASDGENASAMLQFGAKDPWSMLEEMKEELDHEKALNANLRLQLQKTQESNSELIFAVKDLEELLEHKNREKSCIQESQELEVLHLRNFEVEQGSFEPTSCHEEDQCELGILIKKRDEQRILDLKSELELYKRDRDDIEMQMEQLALDCEILKQENHDISSRLEQMRLREQLRIQYECSAHLAIINDLETQVEILGKEVEKQAEAYEANLATIIQARVEQEQRAIQAEGELRKSRWKNATTVEQLQEEFKRLASQLSNTFYINEDMIMKSLEECRELRMEKHYMGALLEKKNDELSSLQHQHQVKCQQLLSLIDLKTREVDRVLMELEDKKEEISILKAEIEQLSREKRCLSAEVERRENLVTEIERLKTSTKDIEMLLQERNMESEMLGKELRMLKEEARLSSEELNALRHLKAEQETAIKTLYSKLQTLTPRYPDMKQCLTDAEDKEFVNFVHENYVEGIRSELIANEKTEVEGLVSCAYDQRKIAEVLSELAELKERNESMEAELKEMQERYSEMSLKFAEVEGERQQLVIRIRSLKSALKN